MDDHSEYHIDNAFCGNAGPEEMQHLNDLIDELTDDELKLLVGIPLVNVYEKSLNALRDGDLKYINPDDYIHPSFEGVDFIGHEIANFIYTEQILPR